MLMKVLATLLYTLTLTQSNPDGGMCKATSIATGRHYTCVLLTNNGIQCWGYNGYGQLGYGDTHRRGDSPGEMGDNLPIVDLGTNFVASAIAVGWYHTCALSCSGTVKCWGYNYYGQLGYGDPNGRGDNLGEMGDNLPIVDLGNDFVASAIALGWYHTCALSRHGTVKCWGWNIYGQLGYGDRNDRGDNPDEMGNNLPIVDLGTDFVVSAIALGLYHTCALSCNGTVKCWGYNYYGQLGYGDGNYRGDNPDEMGDNLPLVALGDDFVASTLDLGGYHTCALSPNGTVKCWGYNSDGQLGYGDTHRRGDSPGDMGDNLALVDLGTDFVASAIALGDDHTCALSRNGTVKCWGDNNDGQLGYGDTNERGDRPGDMGNNLSIVDLGNDFVASTLDLGGYHTCALSPNGAVKCWGGNYFGQLGYGDRNERGDSPGAMGNNLPLVDLGNTACYPTPYPTQLPTSYTAPPTCMPSYAPTLDPTMSPTTYPSVHPTQLPTSYTAPPTKLSSAFLTFNSTGSPTVPTNSPTLGVILSVGSGLVCVVGVCCLFYKWRARKDRDTAKTVSMPAVHGTEVAKTKEEDVLPPAPKLVDALAPMEDELEEKGKDVMEQRKVVSLPKSLGTTPMLKGWLEGLGLGTYYATIEEVGGFGNDLDLFLESELSDINALCAKVGMKLGDKNRLRRGLQSGRSRREGEGTLGHKVNFF